MAQPSIYPISMHLLTEQCQTNKMHLLGLLKVMVYKIGACSSGDDTFFDKFLY